MRQDAILATHVVRCFDLGADWRATQDELAVSGVDEVRQIREARGVLVDD